MSSISPTPDATTIETRDRVIVPPVCTRFPCDFAHRRQAHAPGAVYHRAAVMDRSDMLDGELIRLWAVAIAAPEHDGWVVQVHLDHPEYAPGGIELEVDDAANMSGALAKAIAWAATANLAEAEATR